MGGKIGLLSEVDVGSIFWFELILSSTEPQGIDLTEELTSNVRLRSDAQAIAATRSGKVHKLRGARILVAEDNATNQRVAQLILESGGHSVTIVENGEAALDALERGGFDVALFDLSMPVVSGLEALKLCQRHDGCDCRMSGCRSVRVHFQTAARFRPVERNRTPLGNRSRESRCSRATRANRGTSPILGS